MKIITTKEQAISLLVANGKDKGFATAMINEFYNYGGGDYDELTNANDSTEGEDVVKVTKTEEEILTMYNDYLEFIIVEESEEFQRTVIMLYDVPYERNGNYICYP